MRKLTVPSPPHRQHNRPPIRGSPGRTTADPGGGGPTVYVSCARGASPPCGPPGPIGVPGYPPGMPAFGAGDTFGLTDDADLRRRDEGHGEGGPGGGENRDG